jgi:hypothetical protein
MPSMPKPVLPRQLSSKKSHSSRNLEHTDNNSLQQQQQQHTTGNGNNGSSSNNGNHAASSPTKPINPEGVSNIKTRNVQKLKERIGVGGKPTVVTRTELFHALEKFKRLQARLKVLTKNLQKQHQCMSHIYLLREQVSVV